MCVKANICFRDTEFRVWKNIKSAFPHFFQLIIIIKKKLKFILYLLITENPFVYELHFNKWKSIIILLFFSISILIPKLFKWKNSHHNQNLQ